MGSPLRPSTNPPPPQLSGQKNLFFVGKKQKTDFDIFFNNFCTKRAIFLGKYFKKSVKDCEFSVSQLNAIHQYTNINIWICRLKQKIYNFSLATKKN